MYCDVPQYNEFSKEEIKQEDFEAPIPSKIKAYLDQYVIIQDNAKQIISVAVYNHYNAFSNRNMKMILIWKKVTS